ncbi:hypothetical protein POM88_042743 [Heracleum sosnowskyi]|uniref:PPC domain-containing protein n=1 Tax=Heracleum sosnowskyi TaxID=360622 RepID=A0AAD8HJ67_9APIA|nr:hypothetical protein POM88_042743 [Heracleum sosnowskyi]
MKFGHSSSLPNPYVTYSDAYTKENIFEMASITESIVFQIPPGVDIIAWVGNFAQSKKVYVNVLGGSGLLSEVAICLNQKLGPINFSERFNLMSLTGSFCMSETFVSSYFAALLARMDGTVIAGSVSRLITMTPVVLTAHICKDIKVIGGNSRILARM